MNTGRDRAAAKTLIQRAQAQRARILGRASEEMGRPVAFSNLTMGEVSERSGIPASTILSQTALGGEGDQAGAVEEFRRLLMRRLVQGVSVTVTKADREIVLDGLRNDDRLQTLVVMLVDSLCRQFCNSPNAPYLLAASSHADDEELANDTAAKWAEITDEAVFVIELLLAAKGRRLDGGAGHTQLASALAMAMTTEFVHKTMLEPPATQDVVDGGISMTPGAAIVWLLIEPELADVAP